MAWIVGLCAMALAFGVAGGLAFLLYRADRYEKEPVLWVVGMFVWGALIATFGSAMLTWAGESLAAFVLPPGPVDGFSTVLLAPAIEESFKGLAVLAVLWWNRHEIHGLMDGVLYAAMAGLGFEAVENALYLVSALVEGGLASLAMLTVLRVGVFGFTHALFTSMVGLGVAVARMYGRVLAWLAVPAGWGAAVLLHMIHNASVSAGNALCLIALGSDWLGLALVLGLVVLALRWERRWLARHLQDEVRAGVIHMGHYHAALSPKRRAQAMRTARQQGRGAQARAFYETLSELAYLKAQAQRTPHDRSLQARIEAWRERLRAWAGQVPFG